jgi:hypothetical protein
MLNKRVMPRKPFAILGDFWQPVLDRVREVEGLADSRWSEADGELIRACAYPEEAAEFLAEMLRQNS